MLHLCKDDQPCHPTTILTALFRPVQPTGLSARNSQLGSGLEGYVTYNFNCSTIGSDIIYDSLEAESIASAPSLARRMMRLPAHPGVTARPGSEAAFGEAERGFNSHGQAAAVKNGQMISHQNQANARTTAAETAHRSGDMAGYRAHAQAADGHLEAADNLDDQIEGHVQAMNAFKSQMLRHGNQVVPSNMRSGV
jgi:hypothetical protein